MAATPTTRHTIALAVALAVTFAVWRHAWSTWFTADDVVSLARAARLEPTPLTFRPLATVVAWPLEHAAFGLHPLGYHLVALAFHCASMVALYFVAIELEAGLGGALAAAMLFGTSGIGFTVLHSASSIGDTLASSLLLVATSIWLNARRRASAFGSWAAAATAFIAILAKESAIAWPVVIMAAEATRALPPVDPILGLPREHQRWRIPLVACAVLGAVWMAVTLGAGSLSPRDAYALSWTPQHLLTNLATYSLWTMQPGTPLRDWVAAPDPGAVVALLLPIALFAAAWRMTGRESWLARTGSLWFIGFLLPVLPLHHHSYLYYLYLPWAGGALSVVATMGGLTTPIPSRVTRIMAALLVAGFIAAEARGIMSRERASVAHVPADRTLRDAELLRNSIVDLEREHLPPGTTVGFIHPFPTPTIDVVTGRPAAVITASHSSYYPLEALMEDGRTLRVFLPGLRYAGFSDTIPANWSDVECFLVEQRGYLRDCGRGEIARRRVAEWVRAGRPPFAPTR